MHRILWIACLGFLCWGSLAACSSQTNRPQVVVYTSVDQVYAEPVFQAFEKSSGVQVLPVYDVEATKTVGLVQRLLAEKSNPRADVFWNGEFSQTMLLKDQEALAPYRSPAASDLPESFFDPDGMWSAFGGRARVILVNTDRMTDGEEPLSIFSLVSSGYPPDQIGMANPLFGTTLTHSAALYAAVGQEQAKAFFQDIAGRGVRIVDGNSVVRDMVAGGQLIWGLTDTDDACGALQKGAPVKAIFPDQGEDQIGTLLIPNTVALIAGGPHPGEGQKLIDYLLSPGVEAGLVQAGWVQIPARELPAGSEAPCFTGISVRKIAVGFEAITQNLEPAQTDLREIFVR